MQALNFLKHHKIMLSFVYSLMYIYLLRRMYWYLAQCPSLYERNSCCFFLFFFFFWQNVNISMKRRYQHSNHSICIAKQRVRRLGPVSNATTNVDELSKTKEKKKREKNKYQCYIIRKNVKRYHDSKNSYCREWERERGKRYHRIIQTLWKIKIIIAIKRWVDG